MLATYIGFEPIDIYSDSVATTPSSLVGLNLLVPGTGVEPAKVSVLNAVAVPICIHHRGVNIRKLLLIPARLLFRHRIRFP